MRCNLIASQHAAGLVESEAKGCCAWLSLRGTAAGMVCPELQPGLCQGCCAGGSGVEFGQGASLSSQVPSVGHSEPWLLFSALGQSRQPDPPACWAGSQFNLVPSLVPGLAGCSHSGQPSPSCGSPWGWPGAGRFPEEEEGGEPPSNEGQAHFCGLSSAEAME